MEVIRTGAAKMGDLRSDGVSPNRAKKGVVLMLTEKKKERRLQQTRRYYEDILLFLQLRKFYRVITTAVCRFIKQQVITLQPATLTLDKVDIKFFLYNIWPIIS